jgi:hypothetical protein
MLLALAVVAAAAPDLRVHINAPSGAVVHVGVLGPRGEETWACRARGPAPASCPPDEGWYTEPGTYTVTARFARGFRREQRALEVEVVGTERRLDVDASSRPSDGVPLAVEVKRWWPLPAGLHLERAWELGTEPPRYRFVNGSTTALYGDLGIRPFLGRVEVWARNGWRRAERGPVCLSIGSGSIAPGTTGWSIEGSGASKLVAPGRYRYAVHVSTTDPRTNPEVSDWWELTDVFEVMMAAAD